MSATQATTIKAEGTAAGKTVRETTQYRLTRSSAGWWFVRCLVPNVTPRGRRISAADARTLQQFSASEFDGSCCIELGVGIYQEGAR